LKKIRLKDHLLKIY